MIQDAVMYSNRWMEIIQKTELTVDEAKSIIEESKDNFAEYFNRGWLDYRKSVTEAGDWARVE
jgi:putrescine aminotransferase